jgi:hypothetical protein
MAITLIQAPAADSFVASDSPILYSWTSNQTGQPNFSFVVDTYIDATLVSSDAIYPEVGGTTSKWDASKITRHYVTKPLRPTTLYIATTAPLLRISVRERYGVVPTSGSPVLTDPVKVVKAALTNGEYINGAIATDFTPSIKWLTRNPAASYLGLVSLVSRSQNVYASILCVDITLRIFIDFFTSDGFFLDTYSEVIGGGFDRMDVNVSSNTVDFLLASLGHAETVDDLGKILVYTSSSESLVFEYLPAECNTLTPLSWINSLGGFDNFTATHNHEKKTSIASDTYRRPFGEWVPGDIFAYSEETEGETTLVKTMRDSGTVSTGWISQSVQRWLVSLHESPDVTIDVDGVLQRVQLTATQTTQKSQEYDELINEVIEYTAKTRTSILL